MHNVLHRFIMNKIIKIHKCIKGCLYIILLFKSFIFSTDGGSVNSPLYPSQNSGFKLIYLTNSAATIEASNPSKHCPTCVSLPCI